METNLPIQSPSATPGDVTSMRVLDKERLRLFYTGAILRMTLEDEITYLRVKLVRVFPLTKPDTYISVLNAENKEIGIFLDITAQPKENLECIERELCRRYVMPKIQQVLTVKERFGSVEWSVQTDLGLRTFTTHGLREKVLRPSPGRMLIVDADGCRYDVPDIAKLDPKSQAFLLQHA